MAKFLVDSSDVYTVEEAAAMLSKSRMTIFRWIKDGSLIPLKIHGRTLIPKTEIERITRAE